MDVFKLLFALLITAIFAGETDTAGQTDAAGAGTDNSGTRHTSRPSYVQLFANAKLRDVSDGDPMTFVLNNNVASFDDCFNTLSGSNGCGGYISYCTGSHPSCSCNLLIGDEVEFAVPSGGESCSVYLDLTTRYGSEYEGEVGEYDFNQISSEWQTNGATTAYTRNYHLLASGHQCIPGQLGDRKMWQLSKTASTVDDCYDLTMNSHGCGNYFVAGSTSSSSNGGCWCSMSRGTDCDIGLSSIGQNVYIRYGMWAGEEEETWLVNGQDLTGGGTGTNTGYSMAMMNANCVGATSDSPDTANWWDLGAKTSEQECYDTAILASLCGDYFVAGGTDGACWCSLNTGSNSCTLLSSTTSSNVYQITSRAAANPGYNTGAGANIGYGEAEEPEEPEEPEFPEYPYEQPVLRNSGQSEQPTKTSIPVRTLIMYSLCGIVIGFSATYLCTRKKQDLLDIPDEGSYYEMHLDA